MEFYQVINTRRTVRDFRGGEISDAVLERILDAGLKAPSNNHLRQWEFIVIRDPQRKVETLQYARAFAESGGKELLAKMEQGSIAYRMYADAFPKQFAMLNDASVLLIPFFKAAPAFFQPVAINSYNSLAAVWCCVENILLAAAAEGLACSLRIPTGDEGPKVSALLNAPEGYVMPCYIGIGYPKEDAGRPEQIQPDVKERIHIDRW